MKRSFLRRLRREVGRTEGSLIHIHLRRAGGLAWAWGVEGQVLFALGGIGRTAEAVFWDARIEQTSSPFPATRAKKAYSQFSFLSWASEQASA